TRAPDSTREHVQIPAGKAENESRAALLDSARTLRHSTRSNPGHAGTPWDVPIARRAASTQLLLIVKSQLGNVNSLPQNWQPGRWRNQASCLLAKLRVRCWIRAVVSANDALPSRKCHISL